MERNHTGCTVLVADDDPRVHEVLAEAFQHEKMQMISAFDGKEALTCARKYHLDAIILDVMMPKMGGLQVCRELRRESMVPILILSAKMDEADRLLGLELGADDYITKPYSAREVVARIKAVLRRVGDEQSEQFADRRGSITIENLEIDMIAYQVRLNGTTVPCTPKEIEILWILASNPGMLFSREQLLKSIWGYDYVGDTRAVDSHIKRIRAKLCRPGNGWDIQTVWGVGYRFEILNGSMKGNS